MVLRPAAGVVTGSTSSLLAGRYRFRSRLEARWAVFFDSLGVPWEYEKEGFDLGAAGRYLPDFWLPDHDLWIEIKGAECSDDDRAKVVALRAQSGKPVYIAQGAIGEHHWIGEDTLWKLPMDAATADIRQMFSFPQIRFSPLDQRINAIWSQQLQCPFCGDACVHLDDADNALDTDDYSAWEGRGGACRISMSCENGHAWVTLFGFHKGSTYVGIENASYATYDPCRWIAGDPTRYSLALAKARSARFEHGESGT